MAKQSALIARNDVVADLRQRHGLPVTGETTDDESRKDRSANDPDEVGPPVGKRLVDHGLHDPGGEGRGRGDRQQADDGKGIALDVFASVFRDHALEDGGDAVDIRLAAFGAPICPCLP